MMCYRDTTFCSGDGCAKFWDCPRALTQEVQGRADAAGLQISQFMEPKKLSCYSGGDGLWCPKCAKWGDHGSGECPELSDKNQAP